MDEWLVVIYRRGIHLTYVIYSLHSTQRLILVSNWLFCFEKEKLKNSFWFATFQSFFHSLTTTQTHTICQSEKILSHNQIVWNLKNFQYSNSFVCVYEVHRQSRKSIQPTSHYKWIKVWKKFLSIIIVLSCWSLWSSFCVILILDDDHDIYHHIENIFCLSKISLKTKKYLWPTRNFFFVYVSRFKLVVWCVGGCHHHRSSIIRSRVCIDEK